jgi:hypothetical protein
MATIPTGATVLKDIDDLTGGVGPATVKLLLRLEQIDQRLVGGTKELFSRLTRWEEQRDRMEALALRQEAATTSLALELRAEMRQMNRSLFILANAAVTALEGRAPDRPLEPPQPPVERRRSDRRGPRSAVTSPGEDVSRELSDYFLGVLKTRDA